MHSIHKALAGLFTGMLLALTLAQPAWALDLGTAKDKGWIGEMSTGYIGIVSRDAPAEAQAIVNDVNGKRRQIYERQAKQNSISLSDVEKIAAKRNLEKTASGQYINLGGSWSRKP